VLRRLWGRVILLHETYAAWRRAGPKRCHLHQPATGGQRSRCAVRPDRNRHHVLDNILVRLRNDFLHPPSARTIETRNGYSGREQQFVGLARGHWPTVG